MSEVKSKENKFGIPGNFIWYSILFGLFYWIMESVRDVLVFERGTLIERIFFPDMMSFWMRFLVVCILILFGVYTQSNKFLIKNNKRDNHRVFRINGIGRVGFAISLLYWILESFRDVFVFSRGGLLERIILPDPMSLWMRLLAVFFICLFTIYAQNLINKRNQAEDALKKEQKKLEGIVEKRNVELSESIELLQQLQEGIVERTRVEEELRRVNRALQTLSESNMALVRATEEPALLKDVCNLLVEIGEYRIAWVGYIQENDGRNVRLVSKAGDDDGFLDDVDSLNDMTGKYNAVREAIHTAKSYIMKNESAQSHNSPWFPEAARRGFTSMISIPLKDEGVPFGALNICACEKNAFDEKEVSLLEELANDLAFGIIVLRTRIAHRKAEEALQESEVKYRTLTENVNTGIYRNSPQRQGQFIEVNPYLVRMFGYDSKEELMKIKISDLYLNPDDRKDFIHKMSQNGFVKNEKIQLKKKDGSALWGSVTATVVKDEKCQIVNYDGVIEDITERKRMEEEIEKRKKYLELVLKNAPNAIVTNDNSHIITEWNPGAEQVFGYSRDEALGKKINELIGGADIMEEMGVLVQKLLSGQMVLPLETFRYRKDGSPVDVIVAGSPIRIGDELHGVVLVYTDMTEHKEAEKEKEKIQAQLIQAQKMEAIGILAGGIAHDFNNLLTAILGCADMAMMEINEKDSVYRDLKEIRISGERAAELTKQLLLFSRKQPMRYTSFDLNKTISDMLKMLQRLIREDIKIYTDLEPELWRACGDRGSIEQVIMNLTVNARDAMPNGGQLGLKTENIIINRTNYRNIPEARTGEFIRFSVSDTGIGMDKDTIRHIFDPFFSTKMIGEGTGLGLSVIYGIVKQHEGWINVDSKPNRGSTFEVYLPFGSFDLKEKVDKRIPVEELVGIGKRILVVEDEEKVREFTTSGLNRSGYVAIGASDAEEAVDVYKREDGNFHMVLSDIGLPGRSGIDMIDDFLCSDPNLRVLLISGYTDHESRWPKIKEKGFRFLEKPYTLNDLLRVVQEVVEPVLMA